MEIIHNPFNQTSDSIMFIFYANQSFLEQVILMHVKYVPVGIVIRLIILCICLIYSDSIQMTTMYFKILTISGQFFANYKIIFQKTEVQRIILRCLMGYILNLREMTAVFLHRCQNLLRLEISLICQ